jgi:ABC-type transporter Mla subunit MlaD
MFTINVYHHFPQQSDQFAQLNRKLDTIMATQAQHAAELAELNAKFEKAHTEIVNGIAALVTAVEKAGNTTPEVQAEVDKLKSMAEKLDALHADAEDPPTGG